MFTKVNLMFFAVALVALAINIQTKTAQAVEVTLEAEASFALCNDGLDNDDNGSTDMADSNCAEFLVAEEVVELVSESTFELCHDGIDNDDNGSTDMADANCANFAEEDEDPVVVLENSYVLCHDGIDNDDNGSTDMADSNCAEFGTNPETPEVEEPTKRSSRGGQKKSSGATSGEVLGASTDDSCKVITTYIKIGQDNNVEDVKTLQSFLNTNLGINLPVTGFYGALTLQAVNEFQLKYSDDVLKPWVDLGLHSSEEIATGYVYKTTQFTINTMLCPELEISEPVLN